jgi:hypothetical protein
MSHHEHNGDFGESHIEASSIVGWTKQAGPNGPFTKSRVDGNFAPQYLHRDGFQSTDSGPNDRNIMRGNLVIGAENKLAGSNHNDFGPSFDIRFGTITGPSIKKNNLYELVISCTEGVKIVTNNDDALELETGLIETSSDVTGTTYSPPLDNVGNYATIDAGHSVRELGANVSDSFAAGPFSAEYGADALDAWDLELDNSDGYATHSSGATIFTSAWKTPRIQVLYLGQSNVHFDPLAYDAGTSPTWAATAIWQCDIPLPAYLANYGNANAGRKVLAVMPYVRGGNATSSWQGVGFENERGAAGYVYDQQGFRMSCQFTESGSSTPNVIRLRIAADGDAGANPFHYSHFQGGAASGDPATDAAIDIKVTMIVAAPTHTFSF